MSDDSRFECPSLEKNQQNEEEITTAMISKCGGSAMVAIVIDSVIIDGEQKIKNSSP